MLTRFIILSIFFMIPAFADEKADKTEFDNLYVKFNDLYANSEDLTPIIEVGEKLYKLAPKVYGKNHINTATVTYKMASLYDQKGVINETLTKRELLNYMMNILKH